LLEVQYAAAKEKFGATWVGRIMVAKLELGNKEHMLANIPL
jgi:hypothetical protein